ncbi:MAG TPA: PEGA domain-containing protein [Polyangiaceae bacterium]|nr:PEGA domain-containing protein [Polyangiaceae bacterium]
MRSRAWWLLLALPRVGQAQALDAEPIEQARALYLDGLKHVREAHWGEALAAFERSRALRPHAMTSYNIGACERALGNYTRAEQQLERALAEAATSGELEPSTVTEAQAFIDEIEHLLVRIELSVEPAGTSITFDGRPLQRAPGAGVQPRLIAGVLPPGRGGPAPSGAFEVVADPGVHVITLSRQGYGDIVVNRTYRPGQSVTQRWALAELPATIRVSSNERAAWVSVNGKDVGSAPIDVLRPAGVYRVEVTKPGFVHYGADVRVMAGEESALRAKLVPEKPSILGKWWFWTAAATVAGGVATVTFLATRSEPRAQRPPLDGGSLGWVAKIP